MTSIEFLINKLNLFNQIENDYINKLIVEQAKEMHKIEQENKFTDEQLRNIIQKARIGYFDYDEARFEYTEDFLIESLNNLKNKLMNDKIVEQVIDKYKQRSEIGIAKYGTTLEDNNNDNYLLHLQQELMDASLYIEKLLSQMNKTAISDEEIIRNRYNPLTRKA
jgi:predicted DNA binding protein